MVGAGSASKEKQPNVLGRITLVTGDKHYIWCEGYITISSTDFTDMKILKYHLVEPLIVKDNITLVRSAGVLFVQGDKIASFEFLRHRKCAYMENDLGYQDDNNNNGQS